MHCVKLRSIMGSYLNIHLNLFPVYVLLLLFTLSHGRPSARIREHRLPFNKESVNYNHKYPSSSLNVNFIFSLSQDSNENGVNPITIRSVSRRNDNNFPQNEYYVEPGFEILNGVEGEDEESELTGKERESSEWRKATGSNGGADQSGGKSLNWIASTTKNMNVTPEKSKPKEMMMDSDTSGGIRDLMVQNGYYEINTGNGVFRNADFDDPKNMKDDSKDYTEYEPRRNSGMDRNSIATTTEKTSLTTPGFLDFHDLVNEIRDHEGIRNYLDEEEDVMSDSDPAAWAPIQSINRDMDQSVMGRGEGDLRYGVFEDEEMDGDTDTKRKNAVTVDVKQVEGDEIENEQQLSKFRNSILKELGFPGIEIIKRVSRSTTSPDVLVINTTQGYPSNDIPESTSESHKWNITKEDYLEAYAQYMHNVRKRKRMEQENLYPLNRRKNALTVVETYYDYGSDYHTSEGGVMTEFSFDIKLESTTTGGTIRVQKAILSLPKSCTLNDEFSPRNIDMHALAPVDELETEEEKMMTYDLTENVTSWMFQAGSSPFKVLTSCLTPDESNVTTTAFMTSSDMDEQRGWGSLKLITKELIIPGDKSRKKRSAQRSTLQNFKNKQATGRDCTKTRRGKTCCRRSLKVKFSDLGISDVIIEPQEFDAHVCVGRCNAKRVAYSTTHAMFQHILHQTKGKKFAPKPCCTPTKLTELDVIHLDPNGNKLQVTVLKDAIVEECGCS